MNERPCRQCGVMVIDVRDADTWATFPVEASPILYPGFNLYPDENPKKNPFAHRAEVHLPHLPRCNGPVATEEQITANSECNCGPGDGCSICGGGGLGVPRGSGTVGGEEEDTEPKEQEEGSELDLGPTDGKEPL